ncbi:MAG: DDE-type integrase/transposase/recombinase [Thermoanaerobaculia bacterium]|nr:DDE-type integrase/transposase/recombinase [Thermoanaerobaculia bacterium]
MSRIGLRSKRQRKFRVTTDSKHRHPVAPNRLARRFEVHTLDAVWLSDITYLWTEEGWLYLAVVLDLASRRVVGWSTSARLEQDLTLAALEQALHARRPVHRALHHSDRGSQYAAKDYQKRSGRPASRSA